MLKQWLFLGLITLTIAEPPVGIRTSNILGSPDQHASFSFIRPGLTQTSYSFNGPSSHQSFSSSIGNPHLAQKVLPNVAHALAYRNPGLGYAPNPYQPIPLPYSLPFSSQLGSNQGPAASDPAAQAYLQQYQHDMQAQLGQILRAHLLQAQTQTPEQIHQQQNLLGVSYSSAPSVAHVNVSGNGYKFHF
ncbi:uncharacterized protein [Chelonus insularis]|uniref:uncharacterized protein n=1 Tax=Chelonus insularis TaxID=460826 RepID=UPI00158D30F6|nr:uncharacterized protein LOC118065461 [Chelonus insularis]